MKVNMTPNPLDVVTIHASQGDTEARQWEFELHNNGELIDTSDITEQLFFKAYKGGTEQILPENTSTPTTSPFKGDIRYPQGLLTNQEFTYRQSPTEEDGLAKITDIKGNTLVWNQLAELNSGATNNCTKSFDSTTGITTITPTNYSSNFVGLYNLVSPNYLITGHKYLISLEIKPTSNLSVLFGFDNNLVTKSLNANTFQTLSILQTQSSSNVLIYGQLASSGWASGTFQIKNVQCFDLTKMGLDISSPSDFTSLFPLSYYSYNQGSLLSFNGNGIKTVGKNILVDSGFVRGVLGWGTSPSNIVTNNAYLTTSFIPIPQGVSQITITSFKGNIVRYWEADSGFNGLYFAGNHPAQGETITRTLSAGCRYIRISIGQDGLAVLPSDYGTVVYGQIEFGDRATSYEPYTSSTLSLPISTYFPTGMKSAGSVYDELTETKAITRIGSVDLGSLTWNRLTINEGYAFSSNTIADIILTGNDDTANALCANYTLSMVGNGYSMPNDKSFRVGGTYFGMKRIAIRDDSYTDATAFKTAMSGVYLYYELATPTETPITTASLVTENAEIPLSNEDGTLIGKCTEQLSENPGFFDAKIKLADSDGKCYSNKIQLHIERSPQ